MERQEQARLQAAEPAEFQPELPESALLLELEFQVVPDGRGAAMEPQALLRQPEFLLQAQELEALLPACGGGEHLLRERAPARALLLQELLHRGDGASLREPVRMHVRVFPSPSAHGLARSGRR